MKCHAVLESPPASAAKRSAGAARPSRVGMVQTKLSVGGSDDAFEHEAERAADAVTGPGAHTRGTAALGLTPLVQCAPEPHARKDDDDDARKKLQKKSAAPADKDVFESMGVPRHLEDQISMMSASGDKLTPADRAFYEDRFGQTFSDVRVHSGPQAAKTSAALNARAFTVGQHIFFGQGEYRPQTAAGRHLMAHELAHTIQQSPPAARAARKVQRGFLDDPKGWALGKLRDFAVDLPGYRLLTVLLARDPFTEQPVERSAENIVHGILDFVPGGEEIFQNLQASKSLQRFVEYFDQQVKTLDLSWSTIKSLIEQAWKSVDVTNPSGTWAKLKAIIEPPLTRLKTFAVNMGRYILDAIKKKVLEWLRDWATKMRGYPLLTFILGKDPFTDEPVPRTPTTFVKAVLSLVKGGDKIFENLQKSRTIERTVEWLHQEVVKLDLSWEKIKALFRKAWDVISIADLLHPVQFVDKIREIFEAPAVRVVDFAAAVGKKVLEFIFEGIMLVAGPLGTRIVAVFKKASAVLSTIVADPVAFLGHLIDAAALGFKQFQAKIGEYLKEGLIAWLVGALEGGGVVLPKVWDLKGILSLALQIMGITYAKMKAKVVKGLDALGLNGEKIVSTAEKVWSFLVTLVTEGPAAAWQKITESLGNFWDMVMGAIKNWAITKIIKAAVTKLLTMFSPVGAVIQAIIGIYNTVSFFVSHINQILALVEAITDSIANIAAGKIAAAANYVEKTLARTIPVVIGFLANLIGLGDISEGIRKAIEGFQQLVDKAIDAAIEWIVQQIKKLFGKEEEEEDEPHDEKWKAAAAAVKQELDSLSDEETTQEKIKEKLPEWKQKYEFSELEVKLAENEFQVRGSMSPENQLVAEKKSQLHTGTAADPIPISWYKIPKDYLPISLPTISEEISMFEPKQVKDLRPNHAGEDLLLGVSGENNIEANPILKRTSGTKDKRTGAQREFRNALDALGYEWKGDDADHVKDLAFDGADAFSNLWPLDSEVNQIGYGYTRDYKVEFIDTDKNETRTTNLMNLDGKYFKVTGFSHEVPKEPGGKD